MSKQLGKLEAQDQIAGARYVFLKFKKTRWLSQQSYVDPGKIALWGWSYGGYLTAKVLEVDSGVISLGMSVAPVTDWKYYDTMYTERYMKTPQMNPEGYQSSSVSKMDGFQHAKFLLAHGTADDNVHFQHAAQLIWYLTGSHAKNYRVQYYTDSDHGISANGARSAIYDLLRSFVSDAFGVNDKT